MTNQLNHDTTLKASDIGRQLSELSDKQLEGVAGGFIPALIGPAIGYGVGRGAEAVLERMRMPEVSSADFIRNIYP